MDGDDQVTVSDGDDYIGDGDDQVTVSDGDDCIGDGNGGDR